MQCILHSKLNSKLNHCVMFQDNFTDAFNFISLLPNSVTIPAFLLNVVMCGDMDMVASWRGRQFPFEIQINSWAVLCAFWSYVRGHNNILSRTNFRRSETRGGKNNVHYRMKQWLPHLIGSGSVAHIVHNALKYTCDVMPFDVECVVVKIYSYLYIYTTHVTALKEFCEVCGVELLKLLGYAKTRFLALGPAIKEF